MKKLTTLKDIQDMHIDKSDFVMQHKNTIFTDLYRADQNTVLG